MGFLLPLLAIWLGLSCFVSNKLVGATEVCRKCSDPHRFEYPAVGFDLTMDYGTSAVYFPNHGVVSIAKIEGSQRYKSLMRSLAQGQVLRNEPWEGRFSACLEFFKRFIPQSLSKELARWQAPTRSPVNAMLFALQAATEAYLETPLNTSDIVTSTGLSRSNRHLLDHELISLGLRRTLGGIPSALEAIIYANDMPRNWSHLSGIGEARLILAVDYSRSALTAGLFILESGVVDDYRFLQDVDIGADASPSNLPWSEELLLKRKRLLQEAASLTITDAGSELPERISELVLIGDRANDFELLELLEEVVGTGPVAKMREDTQRDRADPIFTGGKGIAALSKESIDEGEQSCLAWDCKGSWDSWTGL